MLEGVVPFPPEFARRYREKGYWVDKSLAQEFRESFQRNAERVAVIGGDLAVSYRELDEISDRLALNLLDLGLRPLDRVCVQLPNVVQFVYLYIALQKIGCIPVAAMPAHRYAEVSQFVKLSGASACVLPDRMRGFDFQGMAARIRGESAALKHVVVLGRPEAGNVSLDDLVSRPSKRRSKDLESVSIDPTDPAVFQLSGGTTGIPKLIPRTHNDYAYNSKMHASATGVTAESVLLLVLPIAHNFPLGGPGLQGSLFHGARVVLGTSTKAGEIFDLIERHRVTHLKVVPALLIRLINDPSIKNFDLSSLKLIQSGGQRMQPETRIRARQLIPSAMIQENFGMAEGLVMAVRFDDPEEVKLETVGRPICPDDEVRLIDDEGREVAFGELGEMCCRGPYTLRGYFAAPEHNAKAFTADGFYKSGDLMRQHPSGNYIVEGRVKDLINRGGEKISAEEVENLILSHPAVINVACVPCPDPLMGERMCACVILRPGHRLTLEELVEFLKKKEVARYKLPERLRILTDFRTSTFGKVSKKALADLVAREAAAEREGGNSR